jgi:predicted enzyme related to lactoylglutathione lyase
MLRAMVNTGRVVWYELLTSDVNAAIAFYTEVIGWKTQAWEAGNYTMWASAQGPLGGVTQLPEQAKQMGAWPYWQGNAQVANLDTAIAKVKELGGKILVTEEVPTVGRFAVIADPQGAVIALYTPVTEMAARDTGREGEFQWHELYTTDHVAALAFYGEVCGWKKLAEHDMGGGMGTYVVWGHGDTQLGGMMTMPPGMKGPTGQPLPPNWMYYVTVADLDATLARATAKGARVLNGPMGVPGGQRIVQLLDPQGAAFALITPPQT